MKTRFHNALVLLALTALLLPSTLSARKKVKPDPEPWPGPVTS